MNFIIPINEIKQLNFGGKGNYIYKLSNYGFCIPKTWLLSANVIEEYLECYKDKSLELEDAFERVLNSNLFNLLLKEVKELKKENPSLKRVAIRSSHSYEDGESHSFSGLFNTELNIANPINIVLAIFKCWNLSLKLNYAKYAKIKDFSPTPCSIVIQEFIPSDVGGVIFKDNDHIYVSANFGLAKSIVDGDMGCDTWVFDFKHNKLLSYETNKDTCVIPVEGRINPLKNANIAYHGLKDLLVVEDNNFGRTIKVRLNQKDRLNKVLSNMQLKQLIETCQRVSNKLDVTNYDIEWTFYDQKLFILQCRPLTRKIAFSKKENSNEGLGLVKGEFIGKPYLVTNEMEAQQFPKGALLVANKLEGSIISAAMKAGGCLVTSKSLLSHSAIIAREIGIPAVGSVDIKNIDLSKMYYINGDKGIYKIVKAKTNQVFNNSQIKIKKQDRKIIQYILNASEKFAGDLNKYIE